MTTIINMEIKARSSNQNIIREYLIKNATLNKGTDLQIDTYFNTKIGRLKLREGKIENALIHYIRSNDLETKQSLVKLIKLNPGSGIKEMLELSNGIKVVVKKTREIYFINNIKFHLDQVEGLGSFVEIEAIDTNGTYSKDQLKAQCDQYIGIFNITKTDLISNSYSDLILEKSKKFSLELHKDFETFIQEIDEKLLAVNIDLRKQKVDHVCYRVDSIEKYNDHKMNFALIGKLLVESNVGGRMISTYKLYQPLSAHNGLEISVLELPAPKIKNGYLEGFEHIEIVIEDTFENFSQKYSKLDFNWDGTHKNNNPELKLSLSDKCSVKFHHQSLEEVIRQELLASN